MVFFFLVSRRPPSSPLFPYTTLFRSLPPVPPLLAGPQAATPNTQNRTRVSRTIVRDRKSTRLNSSHTVISYAVFCLKKKKREGFEVDIAGTSEQALEHLRNRVPDLIL